MKKASQAAAAVGFVVLGYGLGRAQTAPLKSGVVTMAQAADRGFGRVGRVQKELRRPIARQRRRARGHWQHQGRHREPSAAHARRRGVPLSR